MARLNWTALSGSFGDAAAFSFCQDKIVSTGGEAGMFAVQGRRRMEARMVVQGSRQGLRCGQAAARTTRRGAWVHRWLGNWRMAGVSAASAGMQLRKLEAWHSTAPAQCHTFHERLSSCPALRIDAVRVDPPRSTAFTYSRKAGTSARGQHAQ